MNKTLSLSKVDLKRMSQETGIPPQEIQNAFLNTINNFKRKSSIINIPSTVKNIVVDKELQRAEQNKKFREQVVSATDSSEAYELFRQADEHSEEESIAYEKLCELLREEIPKVKSRDEIQEIFDRAPKGSKEETLALQVFLKILTADCGNITDLDELKDIVNDMDENDPDASVVLKRIVTLCETSDDIDEVDDWFPDNYPEYDLFKKKCSEIFAKEIDAESDIDELQNIATKCDENEDDENYNRAVDRMLSVCSDFDDAVSIKEYVPDESEWKLKAIRKMIEFIQDRDNFNDTSDLVHSGSTESALLNAKEAELLDTEIKEASGDVDELKDLYENKTDSFPEQKRKVLEELLKCVDEYDEVSEVFDLTGVSSEDEVRVIEKWRTMILADLKKEGEIYELKELHGKARKNSSESYEILNKMITIATEDDIDEVIDFCPSDSHAAHLAYLKKKSFNSGSAKQSVSFVSQPTVTVSTETELDRNMKRARSMINSSYNPESAYDAWNITPNDTPEKSQAAEKLDGFIYAALKNDLALSQLQSIYRKSVSGSESQSAIIRSMASHFEKKGFFSFLKF